MSMYIVSKANDRFRPGTWFECFDHGCQEVQTTTEQNRVRVVKPIGFIMPFSEIQPYVSQSLRRGLNHHAG